MAEFSIVKRLRCTLPSALDGFTLPEVLVASLIAAAIAAITAQLLIGQLFEERRLDVAQRLRQDVSRLNYLIQIESSEAEDFDFAAAPVCADGGALFTMYVHPPTGAYQDDTTRRSIQYYNANDSEGSPAIWRCGPRVKRNGVIDFANAANEAGIVLRNAQLTLDPAGCQASTTRNVTYQVTPTVGLAGANLGNLGGCTTAYARSVFICNPPVGAGGAVGDC